MNFIWNGELSLQNFAGVTAQIVPPIDFLMLFLNLKRNIISIKINVKPDICI